MRHRRLLFAATPALSFSVNSSRTVPARNKQLSIRLVTRSQSVLLEGVSHRTNDNIICIQLLCSQLRFCQTNNNKLLTSNRVRSSGRKHGRNDQIKRNMNSHDSSQPTPSPLQAEGDVEKFNGVRTKFARRERRTIDKLAKNARVRNSYLKIVMDDAVFDQLHNLAGRIRREWEDEKNAHYTDDHQTISKKQSKRQLAIKPRSRNSLHMTYFFAGKVLEDMSSDELQCWEHSIRECVMEQNNNESFSGDYSLRFTSLATFPPRRQNLIVAVFESSAALDDLHERLCKVATMEKDRDATAITSGNEKEYQFPLLRGLTREQQNRRDQQKSPGWIAHVTLGNLVGGSREDVDRLSEWLGNQNHVGDVVTASDNSKKISASTFEVASNESSEWYDVPLAKTEQTCLLESNVNALGLALGGPVPKHVDLDWNFPLK